MITPDTLAAGLADLRAADDCGGQLRRKWMVRASAAVEAASRARTPEAFEQAEALLNAVMEAVRITRDRRLSCPVRTIGD